MIKHLVLHMTGNSGNDSISADGKQYVSRLASSCWCQAMAVEGNQMDPGVFTLDAPWDEESREEPAIPRPVPQSKAYNLSNCTPRVTLFWSPKSKLVLRQIIKRETNESRNGGSQIKTSLWWRNGWYHPRSPSNPWAPPAYSRRKQNWTTHYVYNTPIARREKNDTGSDKGISTV
jgi:hypothetical protein